MAPRAPAPRVQNRLFDSPPGAAVHDTFPVVDSCPLHVAPSHADEPVVVVVALICTTLDALTYWPLQTTAPVPWHCVVQSLASSDLHVW